MNKITTEDIIEWAKQFLDKANDELSAFEIKEQKKDVHLYKNQVNQGSDFTHSNFA